MRVVFLGGGWFLSDNDLIYINSTWPSYRVSLISAIKLSYFIICAKLNMKIYAYSECYGIQLLPTLLKFVPT